MHVKCPVDIAVMMSMSCYMMYGSCMLDVEPYISCLISMTISVVHIHLDTRAGTRGLVH